MANPPQKDVIYIDIDDEITSIIDKLRSSGSKLVALVLPKRATMLQSSVNMKLLKKNAEDAKKHVVLITSEAGLLPLAGSAGIHVAKNLQSKPEIPEVSSGEAVTKAIDALEEEPEEDFDAEAASDKAVGDLSTADSKKAKPELTPRPIPLADEADEAIELPEASAAAEPPSGKKAKQSKGDKKLRIPNFEKFRLRLIIGVVVLILLIVAWIITNNVLPKAAVTIKTDTSSVSSNLNLNLSTAAKSVDSGKDVLPAQLQQVQKAQTQQVDATGQKNQGATATGIVTMTAQACAPNLDKPADVPAGSGISANGSTFITQKNTSFDFDNAKGSCINYKATSSTPITAQNPGAKYNTGSSTTFSVASRSDVSATGSTSGGTDDIVKIVTQADISSAQQKLTAQDTTPIKTSLANALTAASMYPIRATFNASSPNTTSNVNVGDKADTVTVTQTTTYTMFGVHQNDLQTLLHNSLESQIDTRKQSILDDGLKNASFNVTGQSATDAQLAMHATGVAGPKLDVGSLKTQIIGKKTGDVKKIISSNPGVTDVQVKLSPFWVETVTKKTDKITITFEKSGNANKQ